MEAARERLGIARHFGKAAQSYVTPGRRAAASPESKNTAGVPGFRAASLRSAPGMTMCRQEA